MSLINRMLRDLDRRDAAAGGMEATAPGALAEHVRPVYGWAMSSDYFWRTAVILMLIALAWIGWMVWQSLHRPASADFLDRLQREKMSEPKAEAPPPAPVPPATVAAAAPVASVAVAAAAVPRAAAVSAEKPTQAETPSRAPASTAPGQQRAPRRAPARARKSESVAQVRPVEAAPTREPVAAVESADSGKIDRRANNNARDSAENEFRKAVNLVDRGRIAEAMDGFRGALEIDPRHEASRQTLVALLLEGKRVDEAAVLLERGLALNAGNSGFAMLLARISVERGDIPGALALLQKHAAPADRNPDYHAFAAALYQRLDRHREALEQYQRALALAPAAGVWWVGMGISLQASQRPKEALAAFTRARSTGNLSPDLSVFVEQRLKQLQ